ncbi:hypothetical protein EVG20_g4149, partial [Dentipellis fragilis]
RTWRARTRSWQAVPRAAGAGATAEKMFDVMTISHSKKEDVDFHSVPRFLRPHWSKVLLDDTNFLGTQGGKMYHTYGVSPEDGAIVLVRPDGYVATAVPLAKASLLDDYFAAFTKAKVVA